MLCFVLLWLCYQLLVDSRGVFNISGARCMVLFSLSVTSLTYWLLNRKLVSFYSWTWEYMRQIYCMIDEGICTRGTFGLHLSFTNVASYWLPAILPASREPCDHIVDLGIGNTFQWNLDQNTNIFIPRKCVWKFLRQRVAHFVSASVR